ncbi:diguanylate cyclase domain-containing protein [Halomonas ramblicola]|uniref:diguanylate cyclase domain-containing protein n=1 Tax=Halomonas ramblicola TaxID=747349 RepID=UPI0025B6154C|nr:diguanylate cyclase [Halomonas ramblicola]MDN3523534.1 diguanylate cyclase [Halomonas ramblicola]
MIAWATRTSLLALLLAMAGLLLATQRLEDLHPASLLPLGGAAIEQATLAALLLAQLMGVVGGWRASATSLHRALWPSLLLALLAVLFWHQQKTLAEWNLETRARLEGRQMADGLSREIADHLAAMRRFANLWRLTAGVPSEAQWILRVAAALRRGIEALELVHADGSPLTISIGTATLTSGPLQLDALLRAADKALYAAKSAGRNRVRSAESTV